MISDELKLIYFRVPKTASTSFIRCFRKNGYCIEAVGNVNMIPGVKLRNKHHIPAKYLASYIDSEKFNSYLKVAFARNPWDRMVSVYFMGLSYPKSPIYGGSKTAKTFKEWVKCYLPQDPSLYGLGHPKNNHPMQVVDFAAGADFIGLFENLQSDFNKICDLLNIDHMELPVTNRSKPKNPYPYYYDDETKDIIANTYAEDIEHFGYEFGK